jgi:hypothetical protein
MRQYMLSEIEVVTGLVAGAAVAPERRKNMMKVRHGRWPQPGAVG